MKYTVILVANPEENTPEDIESFLKAYPPEGFPAEGFFVITYSAEEYKGVKYPEKVIMNGVTDQAIFAAIESTPQLRTIGTLIFARRMKERLQEMLARGAN